MKKISIFSLIIITLLCGCQKAAEMKYIGETCVVFGTTYDTIKPIVYSFLEHPEAMGKDTIFVPVRILGNRSSFDRPFRVSVITSKTTAVKESHYTNLNNEYIMPSDSGLVYIPVIVLNSDPALSINPVTLGLKLEANEHFGSNPQMQSLLITFSNTISEPVWWQYWMNSQSTFPKFSARAYSLVTMVTGRDYFETTASGDMSVFYISVYSMLYVWSPFYNAATSGVLTLEKWINDHPGWKLTKHANDDYYDFYKESAPGTKFRYGAVASGSSVYGFFDEKGNVIKK
ncbi:MAG: DUF4843 domain-containing protein [Bacteroidales bacterium]